uniref:Chemokine interleukin-8-like domain-containing protein n=1 Tax=Equus asinus TaxID=9793 RepID=A0A9L0JAY7_EQUAS
TAPYAAVLLGLSLLTLWTSPGKADSGWCANDAEDCCLTVNQRPIPGNIVRAFRYLFLKDGCRVPVVVFTTVRGRQLCAPLHQPWVERIIQRLQKNSVKARSASTGQGPTSSLLTALSHNMVQRTVSVP